jgi:SSS family solute:Na+ symporter
MGLARLGLIDQAIFLVYVAGVLAIGMVLRRTARTSEDFLLSGRRVPAWIAGLAFLSANLGAQEVIGMGASGAKYGMLTSHFYFAAVPAMVFVGLFMMPFYYGSRARSVPEYLRLRFDEKTRTLNAVSFAVMTVFSSGVSMYAMAVLLRLLLGWDFHRSVLTVASVVLLYTFLGGLTAAIYNEVLQFFLIVAGFAPLAFLSLRDAGGWSGLGERLAVAARAQGYAAGAWSHTWRTLDAPSSNPMGLEWVGMVFGLWFVLGFGYWCTDFLVVQRAMAAESMSAARRTPLLAAIPKMLFPVLVVVPGMAAMALTHQAGLSGFALPRRPDGLLDFDLATPMMLVHYLPSGALGLGLTALLASFMSGMAGNVTAFSTVWTYDIYQSHIRPGQTDAHYLRMGRAATVFGIALSVGTAYVAGRFNNLMDLLQLVFAFVNAPLFATFLLGMFWRRATGHGAFFGLLLGTAAAAVHHGLTIPAGATTLLKGGWLGLSLHTYASEMAQNFYTATWAWCTCFVATIGISLLTRPRRDDELRGLVYSLTPRVTEEGARWWARPGPLAIAVLLLAVALNLAFW